MSADDSILALRRQVELYPTDATSRRKLYFALERSGLRPCRSCEGSGVAPPIEIRMSDLSEAYKARLGRTEFVLEATDLEQQQLWSTWSRESIQLGVVPLIAAGVRLNWLQETTGLFLSIGAVETAGKRFPVYVNCSWAHIEGRSVMFYEATSRIVDHDLVEQWVVSNTGCQRKHSAMNFHNLVAELRTP